MMTVEHRLAFGLSDILAVTCECTACGVRVSTPPGKLKVTGLTACPACGNAWLSDETLRTTEHVFLHPLARLLAAVAPTVAVEPPRGFTLQLEFADATR